MIRNPVNEKAFILSNQSRTLNTGFNLMPDLR